MKIHSAEFLIGAASPGQFPTSSLPEVAFAGKSNVGKSSLINVLVNRKNLVKTSSTPGKTRQINFFLINDQFRLVDLPGYGFARAPREEQARWQTLIESYLRGGSFLHGVVLIVDARHDPGPLDQQMVGWLRAFNRPFLVVANKIDKLKRSQVNQHLNRIQQTLGLAAPPLGFSALKGTGKNELSAAMSQWLRGKSP